MTIVATLHLGERKMNRKILATVLIMSITLMLLPAIVSVNSSGIPNPNTITYTTIGGPDVTGGTDPAWAYDTASCTMLQQVYQPLLMYNDTSTTSFIPMLAEYWPGYGVNPGNWITPTPPIPGVSPPGTNCTYKFELRPNVPWQDPAYGDVTTYDVVYSLQRGMLQDADTGVQWLLYTPLTSAGFADSLDPMFHPAANGTVPLNSFENYLLPWVEGAIQCNSTWVWFNLPRPYPSFMQILTQSWAFIMCKAWDIKQGCWNVGAYEDTPTSANESLHFGSDPDVLHFAGDNNFTEFQRFWRPAESPLIAPSLISSSEPMMGTGPYILKTINLDPNTGFQAFEANPNYWQGWPAQGAGGFAQYVTIKIVPEWASRKAQFLSTNPALQCDLTDVPWTNVTELSTNGNINGPVLPGLSLTKYNEMEADYMFFTYNVSSQSNFMPLLGTEPCPTLFSDRDLRLAFMYAFNATQFLQQSWLGEAFTPTTFMCSGTNYYNSSSVFLRNINLAKAEAYLKLAWGGQVYSKGISVDLVYNTGNTARQTIATMLAYEFDNILNWSCPRSSVNVVAEAEPFSTCMDSMLNAQLPAFFFGWLADYPDASDWAGAFMSPEGFYGAGQAMTYGLNATSLKEDWPSPADYGPIPYKGSLGRWVTGLNNTYVDQLIDAAAHAPTTAAANAEYQELQDIFYAEAATLPTDQPIAFHYERDWIQGWIGGYSNNPIAVGPYFYQMWKAGSVPSPDWPMFHHDLSHSGYSTSTAPTTNQTLWTYTTGGAVYSSPAVVSGVVFVGSWDDKVYALNAATGALVWNYTTGGGVYSSPAVVGGIVYVGSVDDNVYALNAATGALVWKYKTGFWVFSSPAVANGIVYVGSCDNRTYALNATTGALVWKYTTGNAVFSSPAVVGGIVYVGSEDDNVYALNAATGAMVWKYKTSGSVVSSPAVAGGVVYVSSSDDDVYALNATTGALVWKYTTGSGLSSSPAVANGVVYVGSGDDNVYALNAATGALVWKYKTGNYVESSPALAGGLVYVGSYDDNVYALNATTGALVWKYKTGSYVGSSPAVANGIVYVGSEDYKVYAFGPSPDWPMFHHDLGHSGYSTSAGSTTNQTLWIYKTGGYVGSSPAVANGIVYVGSYDDNVYALNATTGALVWKYKTGSYVLSSPAVFNGIVYVGSYDDNVYALNATTGALVWKYKTGSYVGCPPAVFNGIVYVGSYDDNVYALNATTGALVWKYTTGSAVGSSPAVANGIVYVGSYDDNVYALNAATGALVWKYKTGSYVESSPAVFNGVVYVGSDDNSTYALNATNGMLAWTYPTGGPVTSCPAIANGIVYVGSLDDNVYALNAATGALVWKYKTGNDVVSSSPAVASGAVYVGSCDGYVYALNAATGTLVWKYATGSLVLSSPAVANGIVYIGSYNGNVYAFGAAARVSSASVYLNPSRISGIMEPTVNGTVGQIVNVTLEISNVASLYAFQAGCTFNPLVAHCLGVFDGGFLRSLGGSEIVTPGSIDNVHGEVSPYSYALNGSSKAPSGSGALLVFEFQMVTTGCSDVHLIDWVPIGTDGNEIPTTTIDYSTTAKGVVRIAGNPEGNVITPPYAGFNALETQALSVAPSYLNISTVYNGNMSFTVYSPDANVPNNNNHGFLNVTIPKTLMTCNSSSQWLVFLNGVVQNSRVVSENATDTFIYLQFTYSVTRLEQVQILSVYYWGTGQYTTPISTTGENVSISPSTCAQVTFTSITATGTLTMNVTQPPPNATGLTSAANSMFISFQTNATYHGNVTLQFKYDPAGLTLADQEAIRIWLWNTTSHAWRDITTHVNTTTDTVYGVSPHLSIFGATCTLNSISNGQPIQTIMQTPSSPPAGLPASLEALAYYNITATTPYTSPVTIQLVYNSSAISLQQAMFLQMWLWNSTSSEWVKIPTTVDTANSMVIGVSPHLSIFGATCLRPFPQGIGMVSASCSHNAVYKGYNVTISVKAQNQGSLPQTFTVFVYANGTAVYSKQVSNLPSQELTTITFNFTANLAYGNYSMSACGQLIKWVKVTVAGDLGGYPKGSVVPQFGYFDGSCGPDDIPLFIQCYRGTAPANDTYLGDLGGYPPGSVVPKFFYCTGSCGPVDIPLFVLCYRGQGPDP
jgi:outer membrane protein assembly factor BamB/ABC-type transport system substrate-binding protein